MKSFIRPTYTFVPASQTVDIGIANFDIKGLLAIINQTAGVAIYVARSTGNALGFSNVTGSVVTLEFDTTSMSAGDKLQFVYDNGLFAANEETQAQIAVLMQLVVDNVNNLKALKKLLIPLGIVTGNGSNRLSVDINSANALPVTGTLTGVTTVTTVSTVGSVTAVQNQVNMGGVSAFELMKDISRQGFNSGIRLKLT